MGGYQIIDLKNINFVSGTGQTVAGVYDLLKANRKAVLLTNIVIGGAEYRDTFIELKAGNTPSDGSIYTGSCYGHALVISNKDLVKFTKA